MCILVQSWEVFCVLSKFNQVSQAFVVEIRAARTDSCNWLLLVHYFFIFLISGRTDYCCRFLMVYISEIFLIWPR